MTNQTDLQKFLDRGDYTEVHGEYTDLAVFMDDFHAWLTKKNVDPASWARERVRRDMPGCFPIGPGPQNRAIVGNLTKERTTPRRFAKNAQGKVRLV